ncbi:MAG TPA: Uma2 family endonuclease [Blastocatellia bacterium]|nr:Uma2 family endonuclease [Blastocatellia bacterium]
MSWPKAETLFTEVEYMALERASEERHEFLDGLIYLMAGESPAHGTICTNLVIIVGSQLKGTHCQAWSKDTKVRSGPLPVTRYSMEGLFSYPDLLVVCGTPVYLDEYQHVVLNPRVIVEVLSPMTGAFDRGVKFLRYLTYLESLIDYLTVAQDKPRIEHHSRQPNGEWAVESFTDLDDTVTLTSIGCTLNLRDVYDRIEFPSPEDEQPAPPAN